MNKIGFLLIALILCASLTVSGCSSAQKKLSEEVKGIKTKVDTLETRVEGVESKQSETERIAMEQAAKVEEMKAEKMARSSSRSNVGIKHKRSAQDKERVKEIQTCLKNAGFYKGEVDGVKGRKTRSAIRKFQTENGLAADGVVGNRTWEALSKYSSGSSSAASPVEEEASTK
ncbi:MAG: peptidoglycan-binding domain-containing protein [Candidatus Omnitrophota bacterium]|nr:peptidoglycan-binding domain-containing protein [Candidatus Omnitrophota bacterium]